MGGMLGGPGGGMLGGMMSAVAGYGAQLNQAMNGGAPGMMPPGGMPGGGAPGMGMVQQEPPVPATINIDTTLTVEEVRQTAGHALDAQQASL
jgi:hypothetical protein